jgi:hypothetical protein
VCGFDGLCVQHRRAGNIFRNYFGSTFLGVGFGDFGGGGHLPFLSFFTQLVTSVGAASFFAGAGVDVANDVVANITIIAVINDFILFPYKIKLYIFMTVH